MKKYAHLAFAGLLLVIVLSVYALWYHALGVVRASVVNLQTEINQHTATQIEAQTAAAQLAALSGTSMQIADYFVVPDAVVTYLEDIQGEGEALGAQISVDSVTAGATPHTHLDLALTLEGSFESLMKSIGAIEYGPTDVVVKDVTLSSEDTGGWKASMTITVGTASSTPGVSRPVAPSVPAAASTTATTSATTTP